MLQSINKAIAALLTGIIILVDQFFGIDIGLGEDAVTAIAAALGPILVYLIPNKKPADPAPTA